MGSSIDGGRAAGLGVVSSVLPDISSDLVSFCISCISHSVTNECF